MLILGIDTSTAATSVALVRDGVVLARRDHIDARRHAEVLPLLVRETMDRAGHAMGDLDLIACGVGPGPFTGLRVGIALARAMADALDIDIAGVCSLDALGWQAGRRCTAVIRVRRAEVAWATYDEHGHRLQGPLISADVDRGAGQLVIGEGGDPVAYPAAEAVAAFAAQRLAAGESIPAALDIPEDCASGSGSGTAALLAERSARGLLLMPALPLYLRRPDAIPTAER